MLIAKVQDKLFDIFYSAKSIFDPCPFGPKYQPYWIRRQQIFSKFNSGLQTDAEGLFSATPEKIAENICQNIKGKTVLDAFCGIGSVSIALANTNHKVYAIDIDQHRLNMAKQNAAIYGAEKNIEFITADIFEVFDRIKTEAIFLDPPWGGVGYLNQDSFNLRNFHIDAKKLLDESFKYFSEVIFLVPRQFDLSELNQFDRRFKVENNYIRSKLYSKTVYFN